MLKAIVPLWLKILLRRWSDRIRREGGFYESEGRRDIINKAIIALDFNGITGDYVEFGCCGCNTFSFAAAALKRTQRTKRKQWAFDSFAGLPPPDITGDEHPRWLAGTMKVELKEFRLLCRKKGIRNYDVVPGFYDKTLRNTPLTFFPQGSIALVYIDCDVYSSTLDVLRFLLPRLKNGMIIAFDDYWCYGSDGVSGERRAFIEVFESAPKWRFEPYMPYGWSGMSFVVEERASIRA